MNAVLSAEAVVAGYGSTRILDQVTIDCAAGEIVVLLGPNGAGKSTFLKAVVGLVTVSSGRVVFQGDDITNAKTETLGRRGLEYVPQVGNVFPSLSVMENLKVGASALPWSERASAIGQQTARFPILAKLRAKPAGALSGGERQTLAIARALLSAPRAILLDEPTAALSPLASDDVFDLLRAIADSGVAVLVVEQNVQRALQACDRAYVLESGRNVLAGTGTELLSDDRVGDLYLGGSRPLQS